MQVLRAALILSVGLLLPACDLPHGNPDAGPGETPRVAPQTANLNGVAFDPEYYFVSFASCSDPVECPPPILISPDEIPHLAAATVARATVGVVEPGKPGTLAIAPGSTGYDGAFLVTDAPVGSKPYVQLHTEVRPETSAPVAGEPFPRQWHPAIPELPDAVYVPTTTANPVYTAAQSCFMLRAASLTDAGILEALALWMTELGQPTTVAGLLDPSKHGGVLVWWARIPEEMFVWVPAFASMAEFSVGTSHLITWAPPGVGPPFQSRMGFFVDPDGDPGNSLGLFATVLPPTSEAATSVRVSVIDPVEAPEEGRPYLYEPTTVLVRPGEVTYGEQQPGDLILFGMPPMPEVCATP